MEKNKKLPVYELEIDENDAQEDGVSFVALVDQPAIDKFWQAFSEPVKYEFKANTEKRIISGALMIPDMPIFRADATYGEYYVVFKKDTINKIVQKYFRKGNTSNVNVMHEENSRLNSVYMIESIIVDSERGTKAPEQYGKLPDGSWFGSFKVDNQQVWDEFIKTGVFKGFSVEGVFKQFQVGEEKAQVLEKAHDRIAKMRSMIAEMLQK